MGRRKKKRKPNLFSALEVDSIRPMILKRSGKTSGTVYNQSLEIVQESKMFESIERKQKRKKRKKQ